MTIYSPVAIFVYDRLEHTKQTISALSCNLYSEETDVYIFSDNGKDATSNSNVKSVREYLDYLRESNNFKSLTILESEKNYGLANSIIKGVSKIIREHPSEKVIILEDDLITSNFFLKFMNESLNYYEKNNSIWSISGYSPPIKIPENYRNDIYLSYRSSSWGWGTWKDRWNSADWQIKDYDNFIEDKKSVQRFNRGGMDLAGMLKMQMNNKIDSWAIRWCYTQYRQNKMTIYPVKTLIENIGLDGSGTHKQLLSRKYNSKIDEKSDFNLEMPQINPLILKRFKNFYLSELKFYLSKVKRRIFNISRIYN
ncbi:sugar transferase [Exiguobacterium sp. 17-1]|uniref:sugar transferase n=1 Tax=Exiguobacterium sp. 17-1 TaxID=2931981 RepID=UPI0020002912|nr:sugar transferase [Exiguobacterium sp. 17-1]MCK2156181.1 sugar transferase [Exiguobacterium sp. 17-1]